MAEAKEKKPNIFKRCFKFFREVKSELKKVVWPTRKQVINNALIVFAIVIIVGIFIFALDALFQFGLFSFLK
jgi:preprotein translocase subunit SecE